MCLNTMSRVIAFIERLVSCSRGQQRGVIEEGVPLHGTAMGCSLPAKLNGMQVPMVPMPVVVDVDAVVTRGADSIMTEDMYIG